MNVNQLLFKYWKNSKELKASSVGVFFGGRKRPSHKCLCLFVCLFIYVCIYFFISLFMYVFISLFHYLFIFFLLNFFFNEII